MTNSIKINTNKIATYNTSKGEETHSVNNNINGGLPIFQRSIFFIRGLSALRVSASQPIRLRFEEKAAIRSKFHCDTISVGDLTSMNMRLFVFHRVISS